MCVCAYHAVSCRQVCVCVFDKERERNSVYVCININTHPYFVGVGMSIWKFVYVFCVGVWLCVIPIICILLGKFLDCRLA